VSTEKTPDIAMVGDGVDIFIVVNGLRIAKRGRLGTPQARVWIALEPGWSVSGTDNLTITYNGTTVH
jgi:hypothetical protein